MDADLDAEWRARLGAFLEYERAVAGLMPETLRHRSLYLRTFARWWQEQRAPAVVEQASTADLAAFLVAEEARGMSAATRKAQVASLRRFFAWLVLMGHATTDPTVHLRGPRAVPSEVEVYRPEQVATILAATGALSSVRGRLRHVIVASLRFTGMRSVELRTLRRDRLDLDAGQAQVIGKGAVQRVVVIPPPLQDILAAYLEEVRPVLPDSPLVLSNPARRVSTAHRGFGPEALYREVELAGRRAGVAGRHHPHRWRHTFATELVRAGIDIHVVQRLLGHRSISSTVGYTHLATDDLQRTVEGLW